MACMTTPATSFGDHLRAWRQRRRLSQLDLALEAEISTRHLSFVETGRSLPSREMVLRLADRLDVPLRERNSMLVAAGYAPVFPERPLAAPQLEPARRAIDLVLRAHEPFPALAVDRHWNLVASNRPLQALLAGVPAPLLEPPVNVLRLSLHPEGIAPRIDNYHEWRDHLLHRLRRQILASGDDALSRLLEELSAYPAPAAAGGAMTRQDEAPAIAVPLRLRSDAGVLSFISTVTVFGTPVDVTLSELALESFFPADDLTATALQALMQASGKA